MPIRISGLNSNLDTDSIVKELVSAYSLKKEKYVKQKTKLEWKMDAWKGINDKIYKLYSNSMRNMRYSKAYKKKATTCSDPTKATVTASNSAVNGTQKLNVSELAQAGYLTGGKMNTVIGDAVTQDSALRDLGFTGAAGTINVTTAGTTTSIAVDKNTTIRDFVDRLNGAGVTANFDATNQRLYISAKETGLENDFSLAGLDGQGSAALNKLGVNVKSDASDALYAKLQGYAKYDTNGNYDAAATMANISTILDKIDADKADNATWQASIDGLKDKNANLSALRGYADNLKGVTDTLSVLSPGDQNKMLNLLLKSEDDIAANPSDAADYANIKTQLNLSDDDFAKLKSQRIAVNNYEQTITAGGDPTAVQDMRDAQTAVGNGSAAYNSFVTNIDGKIDDNMDDIADFNNDIRANEVFYQQNIELTKETGTRAEQEAALEAKVKNAVDALNGSNNGMYNTDANRINATNAKITLNNVAYESSSNVFNINGLTITAQQKMAATDEVTITTSTDSQGIYDSIKGFLKEYNVLMKEMDSLYNADSSKGYEPLTDDEKDAMSDTEVEKWEKKIKDSLLRRDDTLSSVMNTMTTAMAQSFKVNGKEYSLSSFGIKTLGYFNSAENEGNCFHIDGDKGDASTAENEDRLLAMIRDDPDAVEGFFSKLMDDVYTKMTKKMEGTTMRTLYKVYNDKQMDNDLKDLKEQISKWDEKLEYYEDFYYNKFTQMEVALAKLQNSTNSLSSLMGG